MQSTKIYAVLGPRGNLAPFYGFAFTRRQLMLHNKWVKVPDTLRVVRVMVQPWEPRRAETTSAVVQP